MGQILSKTVSKKGPHWAVNSNFGVLYHFRRKSLKTTIWAKSGYLTNKFEFDGNNFFLQIRHMGQIMLKEFFPENEPKTDNPSYSGVLKHFCCKLTKKQLISVQNLTISERR